MPTESEVHNSEEITEIITAVPTWILRWGIALIFGVLLLIILLSAFIRYPDVVKTTIKISSLNAPKGIVAHQAGKLVKILVREQEMVKANQPLAFIESTADHRDVMVFSERLSLLRREIVAGKNITRHDLETDDLNLGELQESYQSFHQQFLAFISTQQDGFYHAQKAYLQKDLAEIKKLRQQILQQQQVQQQEYANAEEEYRAYQQLKNRNVISNNEFKQQENKYLASKYPLQQSATELLNNGSSSLTKEKEMAALENTIGEQQAKFRQALSSMTNDLDHWLKNFVVMASLAGQVSYVGILQENQQVAQNQELFIVNPGNTDFFGEVRIPQYNMGKVVLGQRTLIKMRSFPFEEYGAINGRVSYITDAALSDSVFMAKIDLAGFENKNKAHLISLKNGMMGDAEIITKESSLLERFMSNITKILGNH